MRKFTKYPQGYVKADSYAEVSTEFQDRLDKEVDRLRRKDLFKGRVPKNIQDRTIENLDVYNMGLADSFEEACRELAPKGSELHDAWYHNDFRKFIPSAYEEQYLDFKKYPLKYKQAKKAGDVTAATNFGGYDPFFVIKTSKDAYIDRWSNDYEGTPKSGWDRIFDEVEDEFETYANDEASSDSTGRTLIEQFDDGDIDDYDMADEFDRWVDWIDLNDYDYED